MCGYKIKSLIIRFFLLFLFLFLFFFFLDGVFAFVGECVLKCRSVYVGVSASLRAELEGGVRILGKAGMQYTKKKKKYYDPNALNVLSKMKGMNKGSSGVCCVVLLPDLLLQWVRVELILTDLLLGLHQHTNHVPRAFI